MNQDHTTACRACCTQQLMMESFSAFVRSNTALGLVPEDYYAYTKGLLVGYMLRPSTSAVVGVVFTPSQFHTWNILLEAITIVDNVSLYANINGDGQFTNRNWCDDFSSKMLAVLTTHQLRLYIQWYSNPENNFYDISYRHPTNSK